MIRIRIDAFVVPPPPKPHEPTPEFRCAYCDGPAGMFVTPDYGFKGEERTYWCQRGCLAADLMRANEKAPPDA